MTELFPFLKGMNGGKKQYWINSNLDFIAMLSEHMEFNDLCQTLHSKPETVVKALQKAEQKHRPAVTKADQALNLGQINSIQISEVHKEVESQADILEYLVSDYTEIKEYLADFLESIGNSHLIMSNLMRKSVSNLTYHIDNTKRSKVSPSKQELPALDGLSVSSGYDLRRAILKPGNKRSVSQHRKPTKRRRPDGV